MEKLAKLNMQSCVIYLCKQRLVGVKRLNIWCMKDKVKLTKNISLVIALS